MTSRTFFWHDYETFGSNTRRDRPAQFAGIRTDMDLNEVGEPLMLYCQPAPDFLPSPEACLITGITPQECLAKGVPEHVFAAQIEQAFAQPGTIGVGYNSIRFDDEVTRFMFWRNLIDPYAREWQNHCGRWDLLDVVRLTHALRPEGIEWPRHPDGRPSFKLEDLARANGLLHEAAHDALSDVRATIALARLIRQKQPKLFEFALRLHKKLEVAAELGLPAAQAHAKPFLHVSGMFPVENGCMAVMWPLASHPTNKNELLAWNLAHDPSELPLLDVPTLRQRLFSKASELPEGVQRLPVKSVHLNKSPMVVGNLKTLQPATAAKWGIDMDLALRHAAIARDLPDMSAVWAAVFERQNDEGAADVDQDLYGGFLGNADRRRLDGLRALSGAELAKARGGFDDGRLEELVFRYRARNFAGTLSPDEQARWEAHRAAALLEGEGGVLQIDEFLAQVEALHELAQDNPDAAARERSLGLLEAVQAYVEGILPDA